MITKTLKFTSQKMGDISQRRTQKLKNNHLKFAPTTVRTSLH